MISVIGRFGQAGKHPFLLDVRTPLESPGTTKLYDRTNDQLTLDEIEKIQI